VVAVQSLYHTAALCLAVGKQKNNALSLGERHSHLSITTLTSPIRDFRKHSWTLPTDTP
jgi:hypothetical protein